MAAQAQPLPPNGDVLALSAARRFLRDFRQLSTWCTEPERGTAPNNLVSLCRFHHRRHHDGAFDIRAVSGEPIRFELSDGTVLTPVVALPSPGLTPNPQVGADAAIALGRGESFDRDHVVSVISDACWTKRAVLRELDRGGGDERSGQESSWQKWIRSGFRARRSARV